nr:mechanosensitive ion channel family protein [Spirochaetaceae bacterium]
RRLLVRLAGSAVKRTKNTWDDYLYNAGFFNRIALFLPVVLVYSLAPWVDFYPLLIKKISQALLIFFGARAMSLFVESIFMSFQKKQSKGRSLSGLVQAGKMTIYIMAFLLVIATLMERSPLALLSGIGAMTAILTLIFKDTILSLVASIQFSLNKTLKVGDWIEMPEMGADGDVVDITLHNVMVQNWDKTLITIPTHRFLEQGFKNWKGMSDAGGRRIKRSIKVDLQSVEFLTPEKRLQLQKVQLLKDFLLIRQQEIDLENKKNLADLSLPFNGRTQTNLGVFRAYAEAYVRNRQDIRKDMTLMVRQLEPTEQGVALQVYCFTTETAWTRYESIQADIFDHLMAAIPWFGLRLYQNPSGGDLVQLKNAFKIPQ